MNIYISVHPLTLFERYDVEFKTPTAEESNARARETEIEKKRELVTSKQNNRSHIHTYTHTVNLYVE